MGQGQEHQVLILEGVTELTLETARDAHGHAVRGCSIALFKSTS
jgi:hypothetical protein